MAEIRSARANWSGDLLSGSGAVSASTSGAFSGLPVTWASRTSAADGRTSPEELVAAAHSACYSMQFSSLLAKNGTPPSLLDVTADVTFDRVDEKWTLVASALIVNGEVAGIDEPTFQRIADDAKDTCPISRALADSIKLSVQATLLTGAATGSASS
jgi:osmotically inducible protein OsmC